MSSPRLLDIHAHPMIDCPDADQAYDVKIDKLTEFLEGLRAGDELKDVERTMVLTRDDLNISLIVAHLSNQMKSPCCRFSARCLDEHHSYMDESLDNFKTGLKKFATCNMDVFKKVNVIAPADHYIFFELPYKMPDTGRILKMLEEKAKAKERMIRVDILTTTQDKSNNRRAMGMEMANRRFKVPEFLRPPMHEDSVESEKKPVKRQRSRSPSVYDIKPDARGIYVIPSHFLSKRMRTLDEVEESDDDEDLREEVPDEAYWPGSWFYN